jgi:hypothetical protein
MQLLDTVVDARQPSDDPILVKGLKRSRPVIMTKGRHFPL